MSYVRRNCGFDGKVCFLRLTKCLLLATLIICASVVSPGVTTNESNSYLFDIWTTDNGLPQNSVNAILQTKDGYLWLATFDGLVRYDGVRFVVFNVHNTLGIISNRFTSLAEDRNGDLWIGTEDAGVMRCHNGKFSSFKTNGPSEFVQGIQTDDSGNIVAVTERQRYIFDGKGLVHAKLTPADADADLRFNGRNTIFAVKGDRLSIMRGAKEMTLAVPESVRKERIYSVYVDSHGATWISSPSGHLFILEKDSLASHDMPAVVSYYEDREGTVWIGTSDKRLFKYSNGTFNADDNISRALDSIISQTYEDREGTIWLATRNHGLCRLRKKIVAAYSAESGITGQIVFPILQDHSGVIWIGTDNQGLVQYSNGVFKRFSTAVAAPFVQTPRSLFEDREGRLWIGTEWWIFSLKNDQLSNESSRINYAGPVRVIYQDREDNLWFGATDRLIKYGNGGAKTYTVADGLAGNDVRAILEDRHGNLWIGTYSGLSRFSDGKFISYTDRDGLPGNRIRSLYEDADGVIWIGTYDAGLCRFKDGKFTTYNTESGLFNNGVFQILEDDRSNFWMGCNLGIYRVSRQQLNDFADGKIHSVDSLSVGKADGMLNIECNGGRQPAGLRAQDGKLWFPTQNGVAVIDPRNIPFNTLAPPVHIENVSIEGRNVEPGNSIKINPGENNLEIRYTAPSFIRADQVRFRYQLEGADHTWVDARDRRVANYSHLSPGNYTFRVIAANSDGVWNTTGDGIRIVVLPPFWQTWWFFSLVTASVIGLALLAYSQRMLQLKRRHAVQQAFSRRLIESQESERKRISAELHDSLGQSLVVIRNLAFLATKLPDKQQSQERMSQITEVAAQAITEVREISYNLRPYQLDRVGLSRAIKALLENIANSSQIKFDVSIDDLDGLLSKESEINLYRIVQEGVSNIIKHSAASEARIEIKCEPGRLFVTIADNGKGFTPQRTESKEGGFGLIGIAERVLMLGGRYTIQSAFGKGTIITISIDGIQNGASENGDRVPE